MYLVFYDLFRKSASGRGSRAEEAPLWGVYFCENRIEDCKTEAEVVLWIGKLEEYFLEKYRYTGAGECTLRNLIFLREEQEVEAIRTKEDNGTVTQG